MFGQLLDRVPAVAENPFLAVDIGNRAGAGARVAVAQVERDGAGLRAEGRNVDPVLGFGADDDGQSDVTPIETQSRVRHGQAPTNQHTRSVATRAVREVEKVFPAVRITHCPFARTIKQPAQIARNYAVVTGAPPIRTAFIAADGMFTTLRETVRELDLLPRPSLTLRVGVSHALTRRVSEGSAGHTPRIAGRSHAEPWGWHATRKSRRLSH